MLDDELDDFEAGAGGGRTADATDLRNAELLVELHGDDLRFVGTWGRWVIWDGSRWLLDDTRGVQERAVQTARTMFEWADDALRGAVRSGDEAAAKRAAKAVAWAMKSQGLARVSAMVSLASSKPTVVIKHDQLDADPWLLNVANGTIDLRTGVLRCHEPSDLMTKVAPVIFHPDAVAPTWDAFLARAMGDSAELVGYLQRMIGYALSGAILEHVVGFMFGGGANGKSTFLGTIHAMLGDYATPAPRGLLFRSRGEQHPTSLATLCGRRFVTCSEVEDGHAFDEALVKDLTGGDPIECRRMREDFWTFLPSHKLFMAGNHKPTVRGDDEGIWRRMRLVPWTVTIPEAERDPELPARLRRELPGILAWAVRGCLAWQASGLSEPEAVKAATRGYREENDTLGEFFRLAVVFEAGATIARKELRETYVAWCQENGSEPFGAKRFASRLRERGVGETSVRRGVKVLDGWKGVRFATDAERAATSAWSERSEVVTRSEQFPYHRQTHAHETTNWKSGPTSHNVPTGDEESLGDWLSQQDIGGLG